MSNLSVETTEPDPAAASTSNDQTVNKNGGDLSGPNDTEAVKTTAEIKEANGKAEIEGDAEGTERSATNCADSDSKKIRTYEDGILKTSAREDPHAKSNR